MRRLLWLLVISAVVAWVASWAVLRPQSPPSGTIRVGGLTQPASIVRDAFGIPHIRAGGVRDAYFAEGYVVAQDRLFQLDLLRRLVAGDLSEIFGGAALESDMRHRRIRPRELARRMYAAMSADERAATDAYAAGVNAGMKSASLPVEFRALLYRPKPWMPEDSVLAGIAVALDLTTDWNTILAREQFNTAIGRKAVDELMPISDSAYDVPLSGGIAPVTCRPPVHAVPPHFSEIDHRLLGYPHPPPEASNAWAVGGAHTADGHALVASDPHLDYSVPGPWYLVELQAPGLHVAGATLAGAPGVLIGHNDALAWGVTSGTVSTATVYREPLRDVRVVAREKIAIRFGQPVWLEEKGTRHGFVFAEDAHFAYAAQWAMNRQGRSPLGAFLSLDRATSLEEALRALAHFPGPVLNFTLGERGGRVAYHMAGTIPIDDAWSRYVEDGARVKDAWRGYIPFDRLPHVDPSRDAIVFTANNRVYGAEYPYRLADHFMPPYRARRIHDVLFSGKVLDIEAMRRLQMDDLSLPEREFARGVATWLASKKDVNEDERIMIWALKNWDGRMSPASREAALAYRLREVAVDRYAALVLGDKLGPAWRADAGNTEATGSMLCALRAHAVEYGALLDRSTLKGAAVTWEQAGMVALHHPLHRLFISLYDPPPFAGSGDFASVKVQTQKHGQGLRTVWDVGLWDRGGAILQLGESGRPGPHFDDEQKPFVAGDLLPLSGNLAASGGSFKVAIAHAGQCRREFPAVLACTDGLRAAGNSRRH